MLIFHSKNCEEYVLEQLEKSDKKIEELEKENQELRHQKEELLKDGIDARVVSMPCMDLFEQQSKEYKEEVLPSNVTKRVAVEAAADFGWGKYVGLNGAYVTMQSFGASAPAAKLFEKFGFTQENVVKTVKEIL